MWNDQLIAHSVSIGLQRAGSVLLGGLGLCGLLVSSIGCTRPNEPVPSSSTPSKETSKTEVPDLSAAKVIDLTHSFGADTLYWPTSPAAFELTELAYGQTASGYFYAANSLSTPEHGGTHLDAPRHFAESGWTADAIPVERFIGPGIVISIEEQAGRDPDYLLLPRDVEQWESDHGPIPTAAIVLLRTGWGERWPDRKTYLGDDTPGDASSLHFPSYGAEAARFLVEERGVIALGVDTASIDYGASEDFPVHRLASSANVLGFENVANLNLLPPRGAWIVALPMKIAGGSGGPVRIVALTWG